MPADIVSERRVLLKFIGAFPWLGYFAAQDVWAKAQKAVKRSLTDTIYTRIGVRPVGRTPDPPGPCARGIRLEE